MKTHAMTVLIAKVALACLVIAAGSARADTIYLSITAQKQGALRGDSGKGAVEGRISVLKFRHEILAPIDTTTGQATGKRQHKPVVITKAWGASSPQLFQALVTNELLTEVVIDFVGPDPATGGIVLNHRIRLLNAKVIDIASAADTPTVGPGAGITRQLEDVSFSYQRIELEDSASRLTAVDDRNLP